MRLLTLLLWVPYLVWSIFNCWTRRCFVVCCVKEVMHGKQRSKGWWSVLSRDTPFMWLRRTVSSQGEVPSASTRHFHSRRHWIVVCRFRSYQSLCGLMPTSVAIILDAGDTS